MCVSYLLHSNITPHNNLTNGLPVFGDIDKLLAAFLAVLWLADYTYRIRGEKAEPLASREACSIL